MTKQVQLRRGTSSEHLVFTGAVGEVTVDTTLDVLVVHDGVTLGGHYLVGTGYGATVSQGMVNKTFVGIGTTTTNGLALAAVGDAVIAGGLSLRSLDVNYEPPIEREGTLTDTQIGDPNELLYITGIATNNIRVGYAIQNFNHIDLACVVAGIGVSTIELSVIHFGVVGTLTTTFSFINPSSGQTNLYDLDLSHQAIIAATGIKTAYVQDLFVNSGIVTTAGIESGRVTNLYAASGIITNFSASTGYVNDLYYSVGIGTTIAASTNAFVNSAFITSGIITTAYINTGIVTTAGITSARVNDFYANSGVVTTLTAQTSYFDTTYTKLSVDASGSYFELHMNGLEPERYYKVLIQTTINGSTIVYDDNYYFKVVNG